MSIGQTTTTTGEAINRSNQHRKTTQHTTKGEAYKLEDIYNHLVCKRKEITPKCLSNVPGTTNNQRHAKKTNITNPHSYRFFWDVILRTYNANIEDENTNHQHEPRKITICSVIQDKDYFRVNKHSWH